VGVLEKYLKCLCYPFGDKAWVLCIMDVCTKKSTLNIKNIVQKKILKVQSTACHAIHVLFNISSNALQIRALQSPKCIVWCAVDCTLAYIAFSMYDKDLTSQYECGKQLTILTITGSWSYLVFVNVFVKYSNDLLVCMQC
jgi:hypothetical protein